MVAVAVAAAAATLGACGRDDFENEPRQAIPYDVSVKVSESGVVVSPAEFGAGIAGFTILNLTDEPVVFAIDGPTVDESNEISPRTTGVLRTEVVTGDYEATVEGAPVAPFEFEVTAERESAENELLLP